MNSCKVMLEQDKAMKSTWLTAFFGGGAVRVRFQGAKKSLAKGEDLNALFANAVKAVLNTKNVKRLRPQVNLVQNTIRSTSTLKPLILG